MPKRNTAPPPPAHSTQPEIAILWREAGVRCVLHGDGSGYSVRLSRGAEILREQAAADDESLIEAAGRWRDEFGPESERAGSGAAGPKPGPKS